MSIQTEAAVRLPRLCDRVTLKEVARLHPTALRVQEKAAPLSGATMVLPADDSPVSAGQFVELFSLYGSLGYYRVFSVEQRRGRQNTVTVHLEHALATLGDDLIFGTLAYAAGAQSALDVLQSLLRRQSRRYWTLWTDTDRPQDLAYLEGRTDDFLFADTDLLQALLSWQATLPRETMFIFDMSRFPWRILPRALPEASVCEARLTRNVSDLRLTTDLSRFCTRLYPVGAGSGENTVTILGAAQNRTGKPYIEANTESYGVISRMWKQPDCVSPDALYARAERKLNALQAPLLSVRLEGAELWRLTGETPDHFRPGFPCRVCVPEDGIATDCRILSAEHPDLIAEPARVLLTLGARPRRLTGRNDGASGTSGSGTGTETMTQQLFLRGGEATACAFTVGSTWTHLRSVTLRVTCTQELELSLAVDGTAAGTIRSGSALSLTALLAHENGAIVRGPHSITLTAGEDASVSVAVTLSGEQ